MTDSKSEFVYDIWCSINKENPEVESSGKKAKL